MHSTPYEQGWHPVLQFNRNRVSGETEGNRPHIFRLIREKPEPENIAVFQPESPRNYPVEPEQTARIFRLSGWTGYPSLCMNFKNFSVLVYVLVIYVRSVMYSLASWRNIELWSFSAWPSWLPDFFLIDWNGLKIGRGFTALFLLNNSWLKNFKTFKLFGHGYWKLRPPTKVKNSHKTSIFFANFSDTLFS